jgi:hypothetical protein
MPDPRCRVSGDDPSAGNLLLEPPEGLRLAGAGAALAFFFRFFFRFFLAVVAPRAAGVAGAFPAPAGGGAASAEPPPPIVIDAARSS